MNSHDKLPLPFLSRIQPCKRYLQPIYEWGGGFLPTSIPSYSRRQRMKHRNPSDVQSSMDTIIGCFFLADLCLRFHMPVSMAFICTFLSSSSRLGMNHLKYVLQGSSFGYYGNPFSSGSIFYTPFAAPRGKNEISGQGFSTVDSTVLGVLPQIVKRCA